MPNIFLSNYIFIFILLTNKFLKTFDYVESKHWNNICLKDLYDKNDIKLNKTNKLKLKYKNFMFSDLKKQKKRKETETATGTITQKQKHTKKKKLHGQTNGYFIKRNKIQHIFANIPYNNNFKKINQDIYTFKNVNYHPKNANKKVYLKINNATHLETIKTYITKCIKNYRHQNEEKTQKKIRNYNNIIQYYVSRKNNNNNNNNRFIHTYNMLFINIFYNIISKNRNEKKKKNRKTDFQKYLRKYEELYQKFTPENDAENNDINNDKNNSDLISQINKKNISNIIINEWCLRNNNEKYNSTLMYDYISNMHNTEYQDITCVNNFIKNNEMIEKETWEHKQKPYLTYKYEFKYRDPINRKNKLYQYEYYIPKLITYEEDISTEPKFVPSNFKSPKCYNNSPVNALTTSGFSSRNIDTFGKERNKIYSFNTPTDVKRNIFFDDLILISSSYNQHFFPNLNFLLNLHTLQILIRDKTAIETDYMIDKFDQLKEKLIQINSPHVIDNNQNDDIDNNNNNNNNNNNCDNPYNKRIIPINNKSTNNDACTIDNISNIQHRKNQTNDQNNKSKDDEINEEISSNLTYKKTLFDDKIQLFKNKYDKNILDDKDFVQLWKYNEKGEIVETINKIPIPKIYLNIDDPKYLSWKILQNSGKTAFKEIPTPNRKLEAWRQQVNLKTFYKQNFDSSISLRNISKEELVDYKMKIVDNTFEKNEKVQNDISDHFDNIKMDNQQNEEKVELNENINYYNSDNINGDNINGDNINGDNINGDNINGDNINGDNINGDNINGDNINGDNINGDNINDDNINDDNINDVNNNHNNNHNSDNHYYYGDTHKINNQNKKNVNETINISENTNMDDNNNNEIYSQNYKEQRIKNQDISNNAYNFNKEHIDKCKRKYKKAFYTLVVRDGIVDEYLSDDINILKNLDNKLKKKSEINQNKENENENENNSQSDNNTTKQHIQDEQGTEQKKSKIFVGSFFNVKDVEIEYLINKELYFIPEHSNWYKTNTQPFIRGQIGKQSRKFDNDYPIYDYRKSDFGMAKFSSLNLASIKDCAVVYLDENIDLSDKFIHVIFIATSKNEDIDNNNNNNDNNNDNDIYEKQSKYNVYENIPSNNKQTNSNNNSEYNNEQNNCSNKQITNDEQNDNEYEKEESIQKCHMEKVISSHDDTIQNCDIEKNECKENKKSKYTQIKLTEYHTHNPITNPRLVVYVKGNSKINIYESHISLNKSNSGLVNGFSRICLEEKSNVKHTLSQELGNNVWHFHNVSVKNGLNANYKFVDVLLGSLSSRINLQIEGEKGCKQESYGLSLLEDKQNISQYEMFHHEHPSMETNQLFKCLVSDKAHAVWRSRGRIERNAIKAKLNTLCKSILLNFGASAVCIPTLEIIPSDIECANHGATISDLEKEPIFSLMTRGISERNAREIMMNSFVKEILDHISDENLKNRVYQKVLKFSQKYKSSTY
ncbi:FeS cluster assembly protein SufD [Plasmodium falciparum NF54]|uniref:FeS cluster assembly protein SufD n=1 Tax=Plasmodium falciparum (isolate NF54) TaxID=5843 RepID=A0A8S9VRY7_PLAFO|nr:FeS cluster assembly protein SufD [Plasmodium falciparum NF54]